MPMSYMKAVFSLLLIPLSLNGMCITQFLQKYVVCAKTKTLYPQKTIHARRHIFSPFYASLLKEEVYSPKIPQIHQNLPIPTYIFLETIEEEGSEEE
jgi:hypothetical protein